MKASRKMSRLAVQRFSVRTWRGTGTRTIAIRARPPRNELAAKGNPRLMRVLLLILPLALAGCSDKPTPVAFPVAPKSPVEVSPMAERVLRQIAAEQKLEEPWYVRLSIAWKVEPEIEVHLDHSPPG